MHDDNQATEALIAKVAARVREEREKQGMTQADLANAAGLSLEELSNIEQGLANVPLTTVCQIAAALGVGTFFFLVDAAGDEASPILEYLFKLPKDERDRVSQMIAEKVREQLARQPPGDNGPGDTSMTN